MRAALVGTGAIARQHLACLQQLPGVRLAAVCDLSRVSAEAAAERYGAESWFTDYGEMLERARPDVVHVTTPVTSHLPLALAALDSGAHVIVEKPITTGADELERLLERADAAGRAVVEDYNYLFNPALVALLDMVRDGTLGDVVHADVTFASDILGPGSAFLDPDAPHPAARLAGGPIGDFLPHLAAVAHALLGPHRSVQAAWPGAGDGAGPPGELVAVVEGAAGASATLRFSARTQPEGFWVRVNGSRVTATAHVFGDRVAVEHPRSWRRPLLVARRAIRESVGATRGALSVPWGRLSGGPGAYVGLWRLLEQTYRALGAGESPPISPGQIRAVNRLCDDLLERAP